MKMGFVMITLQVKIFCYRLLYIVNWIRRQIKALTGRNTKTFERRSLLYGQVRYLTTSVALLQKRWPRQYQGQDDAFKSTFNQYSKISVFKQVIALHHKNSWICSFGTLYNEIVENKSLFIRIVYVVGASHGREMVEWLRQLHNEEWCSYWMEGGTVVFALRLVVLSVL